MAMALYVHIPYCEARCHYCDFNSYAGREAEFDAFVDALCLDLERTAAAAPERFKPLHTVFLGGGTPSVLPPRHAGRILRVIRERFGLAADAEVTSEANPNSVSEPFLAALQAEGLTRLSMGVQSLDDAELRALGRVHTRREAEAAVALARRAGVRSLSLDFIYGVPGQTVASWQHNLEGALALEPDHLSLYGLILEVETAFGRAHDQGRLHLPDDDAQAEMYDAAVARMAAAGFEQYEISNYARPGHACRHNLLYWDNGEYLGVGPGAVSYRDGWRWTRVRRPSEYIRRIRAGADLLQEGERVSEAVALAETLVLGLRRMAGVDLAAAARRFPSLGLSASALCEAVESLGGDLRQAGCYRSDGTRIRLTPPGVSVSNGVMERFLELPSYLTKRTFDATVKPFVSQSRRADGKTRHGFPHRRAGKPITVG